MINNYLKTSFPQYDNIRKQLRFRSENTDCVFKLYSGSSFLLPFQIRRPAVSNDQIISWTLYYINDDNAFNLNYNIDMIVRNNDEGYENWMYKGSELLFRYNNGEVAPLEICDGEFYSVIEFQSGEKYYSETFHVDSKVNLSDFVKIEWWSDCKIGGMLYGDGYRNRIFLDTHPENSIPEIIEEGEEIEGRFIPTLVRYLNRYKMSLIVPDYLIEALSMISLHPYVYVETNNQLYTAMVENVKLESVEWSEMKFMANSVLSFVQDEEAVFTTCCNN